MSNLIIPFRANLLESGSAPFSSTKSLIFDSVDDYVNCGNDSSINISGDLTLSAWVKIPSYPGDFFAVFSKIDGSTRNYEILIRPTGQISFYTSPTTFTTSTSVVPLNTWTHILVTVNSGATNGVKFYFDGVLDATTGTQTVVGQTHNLYIGRRTTGNFDFLGNIDEPSIFNRVVTPSEIVTLSTAPTVDLTSLNPIAWYRNGDNGSYKSPQWLIPSNENKDKVSNYSLDFDGSDDYLDVGVIPTFQNATNFSISCWLKVPSLGANNFFVGTYTSGANHVYVYLTSGGEIVFHINNLLRLSGTAAGNTITAGSWHNITVVFDGSLGHPNAMSIYLNGTQTTGTAGSNPPPTITTTNTVPTYIGGLGGLALRFTGTMDEVSFYDYSLSSAEALAIGGTVPTDLSLLATPPTNYYKMGENATFVYGANPDGTWSVPDEIGTNNGTSNNLMADSARIGDAPNSTNNALSFNMDFVDVVPDVPN